MRRTIIFNKGAVIINRARTAAMINLTPPHSDKVSLLADSINESDDINVESILPELGKIAFTVDKSLHNGDIIDIACEAISTVFDTDVSISDANTKDILM